MVKYNLMWRKKGMKRWFSASGQPFGGYKSKSSALRDATSLKKYDYKIKRNR